MVEVTEGAVTKVASADITVEPGPLDHVSIEPATATLTVTGEQGFTAAAFDQFDNPIPELTFAFASDEPAGQVDVSGGFTAGSTAGIYQNAVTVKVTQGAVTKADSATVTIEPGVRWTT